MSETSDLLRRFHQVLVEEISAQRPEYLGGPFTVAEIYQNLVPYGTHRNRLGIEMNGDYEDALLRLLAGEGGYLRLESEHALRELRLELESSNPNTGLYRDFAAVDVRLGQPTAAVEETISLWDGEPDAGPAPTAPPGDAAAAADQEPEPAEQDEETDVCPWCRGELPRRNRLQFCPFCGTDVQLVPCPGCGEELQRDWRFCISCGTDTTG